MNSEPTNTTVWIVAGCTIAAAAGVFCFSAGYFQGPSTVNYLRPSTVNYPQGAFFQEVAREHECVLPNAPMPTCDSAFRSCDCPAPWHFVANPGHCEPKGCGE